MRVTLSLTQEESAMLILLLAVTPEKLEAICCAWIFHSFVISWAFLLPLALYDCPADPT